MKTYTQELEADMARVDSETEGASSLEMLATKAGAFRAFASYFAKMADAEAAHSQRTLLDPSLIVGAYLSAGMLRGEREELVANLIEAIMADPLGNREYSYERAELADIVKSLRQMVEARQQRREEDLDAAAAAESDWRYDRKVDAMLERQP